MDDIIRETGGDTMGSFNITCNKCGRTGTFEDKTNERTNWEECVDNGISIMAYSAGYGGEVGLTIKCVCEESIDYCDE